MGNYPGLDAALSELGDKTNRSRQALYYVDVDFLRSERRSLRQDIQAASYVLMGAALEAFVRAIVDNVANEINSKNLRYCDLSVNLMAISVGGPFLALQDIRGLKMWKKRIELLSHESSQQIATLPADYMPLDGRTIGPDHFETIWTVFGFAGQSLPDLPTGLALRMVAENRNLVAHGEADTSTVAGSQSVNDILKLLEQIDGLAVHVYQAAVDYLDSQAYLR